MKVNGKLLREYREAQGLKQVDLAESICTSSMISQIESDKARPSDELVHKIANKLGVPVAALIGE